jgi:hypothetical protein
MRRARRIQQSKQKARRRRGEAFGTNRKDVIDIAGRHGDKVMEPSSRIRDLIDRLAADLTPVRRGALGRRLAAGIGAGILVSLSVVLLFWGPRLDWGEAIFNPFFWGKWAFTLALASAGFIALHELSRPEGFAPAAAVTCAATISVTSAAAGLQLGLSPAAARSSLLLGTSSAACPWLIIALSIPLLCGTFWALRTAAPIQRRLTGLAAGLVSGSLSAFVYAICCDEQGLPFVLVWYGLAIAVTALAGAVLGSKLLR